jgi:hypothetical protein
MLSELPWCDLLILFFLDFLEGQRTPIGTYFEKVLRKLDAALMKNSLFHHDSALAHSFKVSRAVLRELR